MESEKPTYGILIFANTYKFPYDGKYMNQIVSDYVGINIGTGEKMFYGGVVPDSDKEICEYIGLVHALMLIRNQNLPMVAYSCSDKAIKLVSGKIKYSYDPVRNMGCKEKIEKCHRWILFGSKQYFPWKWKSEIWGNPFEMLKKETK